VLYDVVTLPRSVARDQNIMYFFHHNDLQVTLVPVPTSSSYYLSERNLKSHGWFDQLLTALSSSKESSLAWLLQSLAKTNIEEFIVAAEGSGLLSILFWTMIYCT
jgi:hypothetical protein